MNNEALTDNEIDETVGFTKKEFAAIYGTLFGVAAVALGISELRHRRARKALLKEAGEE